MRSIHFVLFILLFTFSASAQEDTLVHPRPSKTDTLVHHKKIRRDTTFQPKKEIVLQGKRFRVHNNWVNIGLGEGFNSNLALPQSILNVDFHLHITDHYFQLGTFLSGDRFLSFNNYNAHAAYGRRWQNEKRNVFVCAGPSYSWGYPFRGGIYLPNIYSVVGGYAEAQYVVKLAYDLGIGGSLFADANSRQIVYGFRIELFFSGAYRGEKKKSNGWSQ
jgi:hypothetical protein